MRLFNIRSYWSTNCMRAGWMASSELASPPPSWEERCASFHTYRHRNPHPFYVSQDGPMGMAGGFVMGFGFSCMLDYVRDRTAAMMMVMMMMITVVVCVWQYSSCLRRRWTTLIPREWPPLQRRHKGGRDRCSDRPAGFLSDSDADGDADGDGHDGGGDGYETVRF